MRKYIITLLFFMGIFTFSLFKSEQSQNRKFEIEAAVNTTTQLVTTTTATTTSTTAVTTTTTTSATTVTTTATTTTTTTTTTTKTTTTTTRPPQTQPPVTQPPTEVQTTVAQPDNSQDASAEVTPETDSNPSPPDTSNMRLLGNLRITGYVATGRPTASGVMPYVGGVAMSRKYGLPYNTKIYIEGLGYYTLNDTGCKQGVVDVFCASVSECYALTSYANVYVVE